MTDSVRLAQAGDLLAEAKALIEAQITAGNLHAGDDHDWARRASSWRTKEGRWAGRKPLLSGVDTKWRPIGLDGTIAANPAPELPDDPDEGETGPALVQA
jgi:hypothetical protein